MFRTIARINLVIGTALTAMYAWEHAKQKIDELARVQTVNSPTMFVAVRAARGDYKRGDAKKVILDYRFFNQIKDFHE